MYLALLAYRASYLQSVLLIDGNLSQVGSKVYQAANSSPISRFDLYHLLKMILRSVSTLAYVYGFATLGLSYDNSSSIKNDS